MRRSDETRAEDALLRDTSRRFLEDTYAWEEGRSRRVDLAAHLRAAADLGWFALALPEALGGLQGDGVQVLAILEEAGRVLHDGPLLANILLAPRTLAAAPAAIAEPLAAQLAEGSARFAYVPAGTLRLEAGGTELTGTSGVALGTDTATHWIVGVGAGSANGAAVVILTPDPDRPRAGTRLIDGRSGGLLALDRFPVPAGAVVASGEAAQDLLADLEMIAAIGAGAEALGAADAGLALTVDYLKQRTQFGTPLASFQAVQHQMAESFCDIEQMRSLVLWAAIALDTTPAERARAAAALKTVTGLQGVRAVSRCIQVSGGIGVTQDYRIGHVYKRLLTCAALFGSTESHIARLGTLSAAS